MKIVKLLLFVGLISLSFSTLAQNNTTYEVDFPGTPEEEYSLYDDTGVEVKLITAIYYPILKEEEKPQPDECEEIAEYYAVFETQYPPEVNIQSLLEEADKELYFFSMRDNVLSSVDDGTLVSYEKINNNSLDGREVIVLGGGKVYIFHFYLINNSCYHIEILLKSGKHEINDKIKTFLKSFRLKEDTSTIH